MVAISGLTHSLAGENRTCIAGAANAEYLPICLRLSLVYSGQERSVTSVGARSDLVGWNYGEPTNTTVASTGFTLNLYYMALYIYPIFSILKVV